MPFDAEENGQGREAASRGVAARSGIPDRSKSWTRNGTFGKTSNANYPNSANVRRKPREPWNRNKPNGRRPNDWPKTNGRAMAGVIQRNSPRKRNELLPLWGGSEQCGRKNVLS